MNLIKGNLTIRNAMPTDAEQLCIWWNGGEIMAHAGFPNGLGEKPADVRESLLTDTDDTSRIHIIELNGKPVGEMNYRNMGGGVAEIGIKICDFTDHYKGMGTQLLSMFIDALFAHCGYEKVIMDTNVENKRAQHVYEQKLGFRRLRVNENSWRDQLGEPQSSVDYEIAKAEWQARNPDMPMSYQFSPLYDSRFPLSNKYDPMWIIDNQMGPNPLALTEFLAEPFDLKPGMRVLDLGCGKGITSVFLAREYGVQVFAVDFDEWEGWTSPEMRWNHAKEHGVADLVVPIKADARHLPFAEGFFDAIICVDSYFYYGKDDAFLGNVLRFLRPRGKIGMTVPGYMKDPGDNVPAYIKAFLNDELWTWETLAWWRDLWERSGLVAIDLADTLQDGWYFWQRWDETCHSFGKNSSPHEIDYIKADGGEYMAWLRLVATKEVRGPPSG